MRHICKKKGRYGKTKVGKFKIRPRNTKLPTLMIAAAAPVAIAPAYSQTAGENEETPLDEVVVYGRDFRGALTSTATPFGLTIKDTPQSIKQVTDDIMDLADVRLFEDLYKVDASSSSEGTGGAVGQGFTRAVFRGFQLDSLNGFKEDGFDATAGSPSFSYATLDLAHISSFEIVKGPTTVLYGQNQVGGTINAITKKPLAEFEHSLELKSGSFDYYRVDLDSTGPLTQDESLTYRAIVAYEETDSYVDFVGDEVIVVAPSIKYEFQPGTSILASVNYQERSMTPTIGGAVYDASNNNQIPDVPIENNFSQPWSYVDTELQRERLVLDHEINDGLDLQVALQHLSAVRDQLTGGIFGFVEPNGDVDNFSYLFEGDADIWNSEVSLLGDFELLGRDHQVAFNAEYRQRDIFQNFAFFIPAQRQNVFEPVYDVPLPDPDTFNYRYETEVQETFWAGSIQLLLSATDRLTIVAGGRYDNQEETFIDFIADTSETEKLDRFTPQLGVTFAMTDTWTGYINYGETFAPQSGRQADGTPDGRRIDPQEGEQLEAGIKVEFHDGEMTATFAVFDMRRSGISGDDPDNPGFSMPIGEQTSKGVELDIFGSVAPNWEVYASVAYLDAEFTDSDIPERIGTRPPNTSEFAASLFTSYQIDGGTFRGLGFGGGVTHKGPRKGGVVGATAELGRASPQVDIGEFTLVDARIFYDYSNDISFSLTVSNLLDERYYYTCSNSLLFCVLPGAPRQVLGEIALRF